MHSGAHGGLAAGGGFFHVRFTGGMRRRPLGVAKFYGAGFQVECALHHFGQFFSGPGEHGMAKGIQIGLISANFFAVGVLQAFAHHDDTVFQRVNGLLYAVQKSLFIQGNFGQQDNMRRIGRLALGQDGAGSNPTGCAPHHLNDAAGAIIGGHAANIAADFHHGGGVVANDTAVAGAMVGVRQVVVDGLGHADDPQFIAAPLCLLVHLVGRVLRIVPASVKKITNVVRLKHIEHARDIDGGLFRLVLEIDLVTAGAQGSSRRVLEPLDGLGVFLTDIDQLLTQNAVYTVHSTVNFLNAFVPPGLLNDAGHAGVDNRSRPA